MPLVGLIEILKKKKIQVFYWTLKSNMNVKFFAEPDSTCTSFVASKCSVIKQISYDFAFPQETKKQKIVKNARFWQKQLNFKALEGRVKHFEMC